MRLLIITCLTCMLVGMASFVAILLSGLPIAHAQDCEPGAQGTTPTGTPAALPVQGSIVLNEVMLVPLKAPLYCVPTAGSPDISNAPRIELYNPSSQAIQLPHGGIDSGPNTTVYYFSLDSMAAHSFIVIFLPINQATEISHNALIRLTSSGTILDQVSLPEVPTDTSYARVSDGGSGWQLTRSPTPGISNVPPPLVTATASDKKPTPTPGVRYSYITPTARAKSSSPTRDADSSKTKKSTPVATKTSQQNKYIQANWKDVHIPTPASHPDTIDISPASGSDSEQQSDSGNLLAKFILSALLLLLTIMIWRCRRLFRKP